MNAEFVKVFETILGKYAYDVNRNEIVKISDELYEYFKGFRVDMPEDGYFLKKQGYFSCNTVKEIEHPMVQFCKDYLERKLVKITLQVTQNCNFRCAYCVYSEDENNLQRSHSGKRMSYEMAVKAVDFLFNHSCDCNRVNVGFYGGEPLLEFDLVKRVILYAKQKGIGKTVTFSITTNGTLLTDEIVEFLRDNEVTTMISLDGSKKAHNRNRVFAKNGEGSFDVVMDNLMRIEKNYPDFYKNLNINMVVDPKYPYEDYSSLYTDNPKLQDVNIQSSIMDDTFTSKKTIYCNDYRTKENYQIFIALLAELGVVDMKKVSPLTLKSVESSRNIKKQLEKFNVLPDKMSHGGPCIPGQGRMLINVNGDFYPCERVSESSKCMKIGDLDHGFDYDAVKKLLNVCSLTKKECQKCWNITYCNICAKYADDGEDLQRDLILQHCNASKQKTLRDFLYIAMLQEIRERYLLGGEYDS